MLHTESIFLSLPALLLCDLEEVFYSFLGLSLPTSNKELNNAGFLFITFE